jgi:hypothetical protein
VIVFHLDTVPVYEISVKLLQLWKAHSPILVTLLGITIVSKFSTYSKPYLGISVKYSANLITPLPPSYGRIVYSG